MPDEKNLAVALGDYQQIRWLRTIAPGRVLVGMYNRVVAFDAAGESVMWSFDKPAVTRSVECWVHDDRAYVLNEERAVITLSLADGAMPHDPLDPRERLAQDGPIGIAPLPDGAVGFVSGQGLAVFSKKGEMIGVDASVHAKDHSHLFALGEHAVAMVPDDAPDADGTTQIDLRILALPSGKLLSTRAIALGRPPSSMVALDGRVLLTAGGVTLVLPLPIEAK
jgi:hypothetical protein